MMVHIIYKENDKEIKADQFLELANVVWPGSYHEGWTKEALEKTINITAWNKEELIGCIRILTDGYYFGTVTEILVKPSYQRLGIGKRLMELAWENSPTSLFLGAQPGNEIFFEKSGFEKSMQSYQKRKPKRV
jgi:ribosomal protein S18 acetylase RimI-like enzyme